MKFLLLLLSTTTMGGTPIISTAHDLNVKSSITSNNNYDSTINLTEFKFESTEVNIHSIENEPVNEEELAEMMLSDIAEKNSDDPKIDDYYEVIGSILSNYSSWKLVGMPKEYPAVGHFEDYSIHGFYKGTDHMFTGMLTIKVRLVNTTDELNEMINVKELGEIVNPDNKNIIDKLVGLNTDLYKVKDNIVLSYVDYFGAIVSGKEGSNISGDVKITFTTKYESDETQSWSVSAYHSAGGSGEDNKTESKVWKIKPTFGKDKFLEKFSKIHFRGQGTAFTVYYGDKSVDTDKFAEDTTRGNFDQGKKGVLKINEEIKPGTTEIYRLSHETQNQEKVSIGANVVWDGEELVLTITLNAYIYKSGWNAEYTNASIDMTFDGVYFE